MNIKIAEKGRYDITSDGVITDNKRGVTVSQINLKGYRRVKLTLCRGKYASFLVHRLVLMTFVSEPPFIGAECMHRNNIKHDNRVENLSWGTHEDNMLSDRGHNHAHRNENNPNSKLTRAQVDEIRTAFKSRIGWRWGAAELSKKFGVSTTHIHRVATVKQGGWTV